MKSHSSYCMQEYHKLWKGAGFARNCQKAYKRVFGKYSTKIGRGYYNLNLSGIEGCCDWDRRTRVLLDYLGQECRPKRYKCVSCGEPAYQSSYAAEWVTDTQSCFGPRRPKKYDERILCGACAGVVMASARSRFGHHYIDQGNGPPRLQAYGWEKHPFEHLEEGNVKIARLCLLAGMVELVARRSSLHSEAN